MESGTFREIGHHLVDKLADLMESLPDRPVTHDMTPSAIRAAFGLTAPLPEQGCDPRDLLDETAEQLFSCSLFNAHPRFFGYITAPPAPIGILGDLLASGVNANVGGWRLAPAATEIELQTVRWIAEFVGYPTDCGGLLVSGGNMANLVCFFAARAAKAPWNVREEGLLGGSGRRLIVYGSAEMHTWIQKAADLSGIGTKSIRWIPTDADLRMDVDALGRQIETDQANGCLPFLVVGTAGSVSTGAVDPLRAIGDLCRSRGLWFHVDAAYGGFAAAVPESPDDLRALSRADSLAVDPHKWLYAPLEAGCALVRHPAALRGAFAYQPPYYHFDEEGTNLVDFGMQNSRGFRALKVWLALRHIGAAAYRSMIAEDIRLSRAMAGAVERQGELALLTQSLSITTFRFVPADLQAAVGTSSAETYLNELNEKLLDAVQRGGRAFVSNAVIGGRYALRACIVNFRTGAADVAALPGIIVEAGREIDRALRPRELRVS